ncbi:uncharacterized protein ACIGJ3_011943 [Trichechus inunguis]
MEGWNHTGVKEFLLVGLTENPNWQIPLFLLFTLIYFITLVGNCGMIILIWLSVRLHTPMYFFLSNLSFCDICYSTIFTPKMLVNFLSEHKSSTFSGCVLQSFFFAVYVTTEAILLSVMAYDRYVAIANPLLYTVIMTQRVCIQMVLVSYLGGLINSLTQTIGLLKLDFCGPNIVNHYFCDIPPLLRLSCSDAHTNEMLLLIFSGVIAMFTFIIIMVSYVCIIIAIQRIRSAEGRHKAFSTCASHLTAVTLYYGSVTFSYIQPSSQYSLEQEKVSAVFYTLVIPMLNPLIYSLRNRDVKDAAKGNTEKLLIIHLLYPPNQKIDSRDFIAHLKQPQSGDLLTQLTKLVKKIVLKLQLHYSLLIYSNLLIISRYQEKQTVRENFTVVTEFILLGLTELSERKVAFFMLFLLIYVISLVGNLGMLFLIQITPKLTTPMYHFLGCLSFVDAYYSSVFAPKMLLNFFVELETISFSACIVQYFLSVSLITTEGFLLAAMAYEHYVAIVNPLLYTVAMTKIVCVVLVIGSCVGGLINSLAHTIDLIKLSFCRPNVISHFFCDLPRLLKLSCSGTSMNELLLLTFYGVIAMITFLTVIISYIFIAAAILRIHSAAGRHKAFSTCASHLTAVTLFYGSISFSYIQPSSSLEQQKVVSVFYTLVIPMLNPSIYSLRNKEVKDALKRAIEMKHFPC